MEFDPSLRARPSYREIVARSPDGPQCVLGLNFGNPRVHSHIQRLYRVKLLKDLMIRPLLDDSGAASMNNFLACLQAAVCTDVSLYLCPISSLSLTSFLTLVSFQIFQDTNYLRQILEVINSCSCLKEGDGDGLLSRIGPVALSRTTTDSTLLDFPKSQSESGDSQPEQEVQAEDGEGEQGPELPPIDDGDKHKLLLKIRDCLGLLRELFFMSRQSIPLEQRSPSS
jgi:hypothetical protein